jgi:hypothetical protein
MMRLEVEYLNVTTWQISTIGIMKRLLNTI